MSISKLLAQKWAYKAYDSAFDMFKRTYNIQNNLRIEEYAISLLKEENAFCKQNRTFFGKIKTFFDKIFFTNFPATYSSSPRDKSFF